MKLNRAGLRHINRMHWRRIAGLGVLSLALAIPLIVVGLPLLAQGFIRAVVLILRGCVWVAMSISSGMSLWGVLTVVARATVGALATPSASAALMGLVVVGAVALYGLQRLLGSREEP